LALKFLAGDEAVQTRKAVIITAAKLWRPALLLLANSTESEAVPIWEDMQLIATQMGLLVNSPKVRIQRADCAVVQIQRSYLVHFLPVVGCGTGEGLQIYGNGSRLAKPGCCQSGAVQFTFAHVLTWCVSPEPRVG
jgi:hypothetical protein